MNHLLDFYTLFTPHGFVLVEERFTSNLTPSQWTGLMNSWIQTEWISSTRASSPPPLQGGEGRCTLTSLPQLTLQWYVPPHPASWISVIGYPTSLVQEVHGCRWPTKRIFLHCLL
ncbi:hypothetical protein HMI54_011472 [Coelomomyces lativittatus]|nr:hypothetical protein HMI54_011472 [Coelomomyces lativittatus]